MKKKPWDMTADELEAATRHFDEIDAAALSRPLTAEERDQWRRVRRNKPASQSANGRKRISVSLEAKMLNQVTALAKKRHVPRSRLVRDILREALVRAK